MRKGYFLISVAARQAATEQQREDGASAFELSRTSAAVAVQMEGFVLFIVVVDCSRR
jgi:hypothetical protein